MKRKVSFAIDRYSHAQLCEELSMQGRVQVEPQKALQSKRQDFSVVLGVSIISIHYRVL